MVSEGASAPSDFPFTISYQKDVQKGLCPSLKPLPPHAKNTSPYYGEGDEGGEVNKQPSALIRLRQGVSFIDSPQINRLRPYQREVALAILNSVFGRKGFTFSVEIARQGGQE
jgi:hypothetical protein